MDNDLGEKSRRERRKEARLAKNKKKFDSWIQHQQTHKVKESSRDSTAKNVNISPNNTQIPKKREDIEIDLSSDSDHSSEQPNVAENHEVELDSSGVSDSNALDFVKRKKGLTRNSKTKFEEYLEMDTQGGVSTEEDLRLERKLAKKLKVKSGKLRGVDDDINMVLEGIPSLMDSLEEGETPYAEEACQKSSEKKSSLKKCKNSKSVQEQPDSEMTGDGVDGICDLVDANNKKHDVAKEPTVQKTSKIKLETSKSPDSTTSKTAKRKKTKFEQYLQMEMQEGVISADVDLALERKLAKKLKVKEDKLRRDDDGINMLFEGIPSVLDALESEEIPSAEEAPLQGLGNSVSRKKRKKMKSSEQETDAELAGGPVITSGAEVELEKVPTKAPVFEGKVKSIAPHLRSRVGNELEEHSRIQRRLRGLLNRLSESNVESITGEMSTIFHSVGRSVASQIISEEILASCTGGPRGNEQYAAVFAASVAGLACLVGIDFGAKLLASLAKCFEDEYLKEDNLSLRNLTLLLSYLYIFGVCSSDLIYDFIILLSKRLMEVDVSTILTTLQCCGMKLRGDDPAAMKNFILSVQNRVNELKAISGNDHEKLSGRRMEFMLETILDIKNNKKRSKEDTVQHTRIKKWLQKLKVDDILIRGLKWSKLCDSNKKGQWWLSGDMASTTDNIEEVANRIDREVSEAQKMLQLAAAQRMNTDARRAIFCIIMSSEDYVDAFEKLLRLDLRGKQDREIMRVLVECCLQEKVFNKYYCILASKLCGHDKNHKFTLQFCLWDHFKEIESMELIRSMHLSKFVAEMLASFSLSLAVLKVVDFSDITQLTPKRIMHFRMLFEAIFEFSYRPVWNIFTRIAVTPEFETLRNGIVFFISKYVLSNHKSVADKFKVAKKALNNVEGVIL